jgi:hypothetical protein
MTSPPLVNPEGISTVNPSLRTSIAALMSTVVVLAIGLAALRSGSANWAGVVFLLTCGAVALALVGSVTDTRASRPRWLGFAVFGFLYLALAFCIPPIFLDAPWLPTDHLLQFAMPYLGPGPNWTHGPHGLADNPYLQTGHCLLGFFTGVLGGLLSQTLFGSPREGAPRGPIDTVRHTLWPLLLGVASLVLAATAAFSGARRAPGMWAGVTVLLTWGVLCLAATGAICGRGRRRAACLGATLFGAGYMVLIGALPFALATNVNRQPWPQFVTNRLLNSARGWLPTIVSEYPPGSDAVAFADARILRALDRVVSMHFPRETPLRDVLAHVVAATRSADGYEIPIHLDPNGLDDPDPEKTLQATVRINLEGVPVRTSLDLVLSQLSLLYTVKGGVLIVTSVSEDADYIPLASSDPFLAIGQSLLALLASGIGALSAAIIHQDPVEPSRGEPGEH